jgi:hypothetical protein
MTVSLTADTDEARKTLLETLLASLAGYARLVHGRVPARRTNYRINRDAPCRHSADIELMQQIRKTALVKV